MAAGAEVATDIAAVVEGATVTVAVPSPQSSSSPESSPESLPDALVEVEAEAVAVAVELPLPEAAAPEPVAGVPGDDAMSDSCEPSAMGPLGFAGQEPAGLSAVRPSGTVPLLPAAWPLENLVWSALWN